MSRLALLLSPLLLPALLFGCAATKNDRFHDLAGEILDLFSEADLICLGESHGSLLDAELRGALVEHALFDEVDVIVVEFANPLHQERLDRLVLSGEVLTRRQLRPIWLDAGLGRMWDLPVYEDFLRRVAESNRRRPEASRIRIVGAALPIDWSRVETARQLDPFRDRLSHFEHVLRREILEPGRKGLAIFGTGHCERRPPSPLARLPADRVRGIFGFEGERGRAAARERFDLGAHARYLPIRGADAATWPSGAMLFEGHAAAGATLGDVADGLVYYGVADELHGPPTLEPELEEEIERRARLWSQPN